MTTFLMKYLPTIIIVLVVSVAYKYVRYEWHDKLQLQIEQLEKQLDVTGAELNKCYIDSRKERVEEFIKGVEYEEDNVTTTTITNLHT